MTPELFTVCIVATDADVERARPLCLEWVKARHPLTDETAQQMLPRKLLRRRTGEILWLCTLTLTLADAKHMQMFIVEHGVPVTATVVGPQEDTPEARLVNRDRWLYSAGLKVVA
jgi:hypothetical protein